jgi:hypothetical protein
MRIRKQTLRRCEAHRPARASRPARARRRQPRGLRGRRGCVRLSTRRPSRRPGLAIRRHKENVWPSRQFTCKLRRPACPRARGQRTCRRRQRPTCGRRQHRGRYGRKDRRIKPRRRRAPPARVSRQRGLAAFCPLPRGGARRARRVRRWRRGARARCVRHSLRNTYASMPKHVREEKAPAGLQKAAATRRALRQLIRHRTRVFRHRDGRRRVRGRCRRAAGAPIREEAVHGAARAPRRRATRRRAARVQAWPLRGARRAARGAGAATARAGNLHYAGGADLRYTTHRSTRDAKGPPVLILFLPARAARKRGAARQPRGCVFAA